MHGTVWINLRGWPLSTFLRRLAICTSIVLLDISEFLSQTVSAISFLVTILSFLLIKSSRIPTSFLRSLIVCFFLFAVFL